MSNAAQAIDQTSKQKKAGNRKSGTKASILDPRKVAELEPGDYRFDDVLLPELLTEDNDRVIKTYGEPFQDLMESIRSAGGVRQDISLFYDPTIGKILIKAGHRRTKAVIRLRNGSLPFHASLPAKIRIPRPDCVEKDSKEQEVVAVISNFQKEDLKGVERARSIARLTKAGLSIAEISRLMGVNRKTIERSINISLLPEDFQMMMLENSDKVTEREAIRIATLYKVKQTEGMGEQDARALIEGELALVIGGMKSAESPKKEKQENIVKINIELLEAKMKLEKIPANVAEKIVAIISNEKLY